MRDWTLPLVEPGRPEITLAGWGHSRFGKLTDQSLEQLIISVTRQALESAQITAQDVDEIVLGHYNAGLVPLAFPSSLVLQADDDLRFVPATRVENACATGSAAVHQAVRSLLAGTARTVLVVGVEKMTDAPASVGRALLGADYDLAGQESGVGFAGLFAEIAKAYFERYGDVSDAMAKIAAKNHRNGMDNPYAHLRRDLGYEFCATVSADNPLVAAPLRRTDCSPVSDGAAALVLTTATAVDAARPRVRLRGIGQANDFLPTSRRDPVAFAGARAAWSRALSSAGVGVDDLDLVELHDCFTIAELLLYEVIGLTEQGKGAQAIEEGWVYRDGKLPVNPSGGLKAKGHPIGATGVSQHVLAAMQLSGTAGDMQIPGAGLAGVFNMGGVGVANYASVLERVD
ncbi:acetyl-CoA acetyltransferase [Carbonactinospora thermoautotrophica]|uniref:acetyl-CoA acetyltransferase n=1 Tax=Carbonactinospora thermoautotrophica TaxID=1469144 RepID=UPI000830AC31|nr:acetyl-CoA acetyltransferase [Carbonactinospora thermoautotrophica]